MISKSGYENLGDIYVVQDEGIIYCPVPKVIVTTMQVVFRADVI